MQVKIKYNMAMLNNYFIFINKYVIFGRAFRQKSSVVRVAETLVSF